MFCLLFLDCAVNVINKCGVCCIWMYVPVTVWLYILCLLCSSQQESPWGSQNHETPMNILAAIRCYGGSHCLLCNFNNRQTPCKSFNNPHVTCSLDVPRIEWSWYGTICALSCTIVTLVCAHSMNIVKSQHTITLDGWMLSQCKSIHIWQGFLSFKLKKKKNVLMINLICGESIKAMKINCWLPPDARSTFYK